MAVLTGANAAFRFNGSNVGCVRNWSLNITRDAQDTTCLSKTDRTFVPGLRASTGSANVLYDPLDATTVALLNTIFQDVGTANSTIEFVLDQTGGKKLTGTAILTNVSPSVSTGDVHQAEVQFQVSGKLTGSF